MCNIIVRRLVARRETLLWLVLGLCRLTVILYTQMAQNDVAREFMNLREMGGVGDRGRKGCAGACTEEGEARTAGSDGERDRVAGDGALWSRGRVGGAGPGIGGEEEAEGATGEGCDRKGKRERS